MFSVFYYKMVLESRLVEIIIMSLSRFYAEFTFKK